MKKVVDMPKKRKTQEIRDFILEKADACSSDLTREVAEKFNISRQAVAKNIRHLISDGLVTVSGSHKNREYRLKTVFEHSFSVEVTDKTEENQIWLQQVSPHFQDIKSNVRELLHHGFTEMMNNVIDHSESSTADVKLRRDALSVGFGIRDYGVGIWKKLQDRFHLTDSRHAILELSKGKLTTAPDKHTGEGIFFTARMSDFFSLQSEDITYCCFQSDDDWLFDVKKDEKIQGTRVIMEVRLNSEKTTQDVFNKFTSAYDDYGFSKTQLTIQLAKYEGDNLVSRSQAKRILARLQQFKEVFLDFRGIAHIGQAFADEIFRVFSREHPDIRLIWVHANQEVENMIQRAITSEQKDDLQSELPLS